MVRRRRDVYHKDPAAILDYVFDWRAATNTNDPDATEDYLEVGETIASHTVTAETGITADSGTLGDTNSSVTVWLSGGTAGDTYDVTCQITTTSTRVDERTIHVHVTDL